MKAINVSRVSTEEQKEAGNSLPAQIERIDSYCKRKAFDVVRSFSFDESAYKEKRDEFDKLLEYVQKISKKEKVAVCFDKVDRLSRSVFDKRVGTLYEMALADRIELHFVSDGQVINNQMSAVEKFQFGMSLGLAKYYSDAIGDNVRRAFEQKRRNGEWTGAVRLGYLNVSLDKEKRLRKDIIIDLERGYLVQKMFELYATNQHSLQTVRDKISELGLRTLRGNELSKSGVENILKDTFYCGIAVSKKYGSYAHRYPKLISKELFDKCVQVRNKRNKTPCKALSKDYIFKGLLKCQNCGCSMTGETKVKKSGLIYTYYSCTNSKRICKRVYIPEKELLKPIYDVLDRFESITEETQNDLVNELRKNTETEIVFHKAQIERIRNDGDNLKAKQNRLLDAYLDQSITKDIHDKKNQEYQDQIKILEIEMSEHTKADYDYQTTVATVLSVARRAKTIFDNSSDVAGKRAFLNYLLQNPTVDGKKLCFTIASPFNLVLELADSPNWLRGQDSNL
ncbi:recombinase family protein [candidate division KSB1 bacterium]